MILQTGEMRSLCASNRVLLSAGALALTLVTLAGPSPITLAADETERDAVLLECCELPDKNLTLTENDLDGIVSRFTGEVPIKLQHVDSPLDPFGSVKRIWRDGTRLLGKLTFPPAIAALVRERGALALSCGLNRSPLSLSEVSLVIKGRLAAATLLSEDDAAELARLRLENTAQRVDAQVVSLKLAGKIVPATEAAARVLLMASDSSKILLVDGNSLSTAAAFAAYLAVQPSLITLGELRSLAAVELAGVTGQADGNAATLLTMDQREWLEKSLGVKADDVAKTITADKAKAAGRSTMRPECRGSIMNTSASEDRLHVFISRPPGPHSGGGRHSASRVAVSVGVQAPGSSRHRSTPLSKSWMTRWPR